MEDKHKDRIYMAIKMTQLMRMSGEHDRRLDRATVLLFQKIMALPKAEYGVRLTWQQISCGQSGIDLKRRLSTCRLEYTRRRG